MEYSVTRLIGLGVALALVAALSVIMWNIMGSRAPAESPGVEYNKITTETLCKAVDGTWTAANNPPCAA